MVLDPERSSPRPSLTGQRHQRSASSQGRWLNTQGILAWKHKVTPDRHPWRADKDCLRRASATPMLMQFIAQLNPSGASLVKFWPANHELSGKGHRWRAGALDGPPLTSSLRQQIGNPSGAEVH